MSKVGPRTASVTTGESGGAQAEQLREADRKAKLKSPAAPGPDQLSRDAVVSDATRPSSLVARDAAPASDARIDHRRSFGALGLLASNRPGDAGSGRGDSLDEAIRRAEADPLDPKLSGQFEYGYKPELIAKYQETLGGKPVESYDPDGFLRSIGVESPTTTGRTNVEMLKAFKLCDDYKPDPRYLPLSEKLAKGVQGTLLFLNKLSPRLVDAVDRLATAIKVEKMEASDMADPRDPNRFGKESDIIKGERSSVDSSARYFGIARKQVQQYGWGAGVHTGSPTPDRTERFGTFDIARKAGFTDAQARRIADECNNVDTNQTHYRDPKYPTKRRTTVSGSGGDDGDFHWHFNRNPEGQEDTRIQAAKLHLDRAVKLAGDGYHDAAERELGIGLHSLQDTFSHAQTTPLNHSLLGEFPDFVKYHPVAMYETAEATEGYLKEFARRLQLEPPSGDMVARERLGAYSQLIEGSASPQQKQAVAAKLAEYPDELTEFLEDNQLRIYVGDAQTDPAALGFGVDVDGDGRVTPGKWVDVNADGQRQDFEVEDAAPGDQPWRGLPSGYNHDTRTIYLSASTVDGPSFEPALEHEIKHAIDLTHGDNPVLQQRWNDYVEGLYDRARRSGEIPFDALDPHEYFARHD